MRSLYIETLGVQSIVETYVASNSATTRYIGEGWISREAALRQRCG